MMGIVFSVLFVDNVRNPDIEYNALLLLDRVLDQGRIYVEKRLRNEKPTSRCVIQ